MHWSHKQLLQYAQFRRTIWIVVTIGLFGLAWLGFAGRTEVMPLAAQSNPEPGATVPPGTIPPSTIPPALKATITFIHAAPFDADVGGTSIDVCTESGGVVPGLAELTYGESGTITVDPGQFDWKVTEAGSGCAVFLVDVTPFSLAYGGQAVLVLSGDAVNQPLSVFQVTLQPGGGNLFFPLTMKGAGLGTRDQRLETGD